VRSSRTLSSELELGLAGFTAQMRRKLADKLPERGDTWLTCRESELVNGLQTEMEELYRAVEAFRPDGKLAGNKHDIIDECVDVANQAFLLALRISGDINGEVMTRREREKPVGARFVGDTGEMTVIMKIYTRSAIGKLLPTRREVEDKISNLLLAEPRLDEGVDWDVHATSIPHVPPPDTMWTPPPCENCGRPSAGPQRRVGNAMRWTCSTKCCEELERRDDEAG
jgi:hypothetical protein